MTGKGAPGYDSCIHVPCLVSYPGRIEPGLIVDTLTEGVDICPTILDYCGVQIPRMVQGRSLKPALQNQPFEKRASIFMEHKNPFRLSWKTIRTLDHKYCCDSAGQELLFDLNEDPREINNVAGEPSYGKILGLMRQEMLSRWFDVEKQFPLKTGAY